MAASDLMVSEPPAHLNGWALTCFVALEVFWPEMNPTRNRPFEQLASTETAPERRLAFGDGKIHVALEGGEKLAQPVEHASGAGLWLYLLADGATRKWTCQVKLTENARR